MKARHRRFAWIGLGVVVLGVAAALVLNVFQSNLELYVTPMNVVADKAPKGRAFRIGGMVEDGSLVRVPNTVDVKFVITDTVARIPVTYSGLLPDLFKEGKGAVVRGTLQPDGTFVATEVLAKHDENYMPPAAAAAMEAAKKQKAAGAGAAKEPQP